MAWGKHLQADDPVCLDADKMVQRLERAAEDNINYFVRLLDISSGKIGSETDISSYGKLANAFIFNGRIKEANAVLDYCVKNFYQENGDFKTRSDLKSKNHEFCVFYPYLNEWLLQAGISLRRYDFIFNASKYVDRFYNPVLHASTLINEYNSEGGNIHCIFNSASLGTTYLYMHNLERAKLIGNTIIKALNKQSESMNDSKKGVYYLRFDDNFNFFKYIAPEKGKRSPYKIIARDVKQPWFGIGYPVAFLGQLYQATGEKKYLETAEMLLDFAINKCSYDCRNSAWSHKLMWGASIIGEITNKKIYWDLVYDIGETILNGQDGETGKTSTILDQNSEIAFWLPIIGVKIRNTKIKYGDIGIGTDKSRSKL